MAKESAPQTFNITLKGKEILKFPKTKEGWEKLITGESAEDSFTRAIPSVILLAPNLYGKDPNVAGLILGVATLAHAHIGMERYRQERKHDRELRKIEIIHESALLAENLLPHVSKDWGVIYVGDPIEDTDIASVLFSRVKTQDSSVSRLTLKLREQTENGVYDDFSLNFWQIGGNEGNLVYDEKGSQSTAELNQLKKTNKVFELLVAKKS